MKDEQTAAALNFIMDYEVGDSSADEIVDGFALLVRLGLAWSLQGSYGRMAAHLIDAGWITDDGEVIHYPSSEWGYE